MIEDTGTSPIDTSRRAFLGSISTAALVSLAGCGDSELHDPNQTSSSDRSHEEGQETDSLDDEVEDLESVFESLSDLPVADGGEFVFDVKKFEADFDHDSLLQQIDEIERRIKSAPTSEEQSTSTESLLSIADTARLLVQQRVVLHQVIAAGLTCERRYYATKLTEAQNAITDARRRLANLESIGEQIDEMDLGGSPETPAIEGYDPDSIERTQELLANVALWTDPAFQGLDQMIRGMELFLEGNSALEEERYEDAKIAYAESNLHFENAEEAFDTAQGRGRTLPYLVPFVEDTRCILPAYLSSTRGLSESMHHLERGNRTRGEEIAAEAFESADRIKSRCSGGR